MVVHFIKMMTSDTLLVHASFQQYFKLRIRMLVFNKKPS